MAVSDIRIGKAFDLHPVTAEDASVALELRTDPELTRYIPPLSPDLDAQVGWIEAQRQRPDDYYWAVRRKNGGRIEGFIGIYNRTPENGGYEWGRWIMRKDSLAAAESVLLAYEFAFEVEQASFVTAQIALENQKVVQFHDNCGMKFNRDLPGRFHIQGKALDAVEKILTKEDWPQAQAYLDAAAQKVARLLARQQG